MNVGDTVKNSWTVKSTNNSLTYTMHLQVKLLSQDTANNSSKIQIFYGLAIATSPAGQLLWSGLNQTLKLGYKNSTRGTYTYSPTQTISSYTSSNSNSYESSNYKYSFTTDIPNNTDGSLSFDVQYVWTSSGFA